MRRMICTLLGSAALAVAAPLPAQQQAEMMLLIAGNDTIARERFTRTAARLEADLLSPALGARFRFTVTFGLDGAPTEMVNGFWQPTDADDAPARQRATMRFRGDSVIVEIVGGPTQRLGSRPGAIPYLNPSMALTELVVARALATRDSATVPVFLVQGGQTVPMTARRHGPDSVIAVLGGSEIRLRVDRDFRILGGIVPAQNLRMVRAPASAVPMRLERVDYSAPAGAPYRAIDVRIPTPMGHTLAGTLTLPAGASGQRRVPAVITSTGSGAQDRDEALPSVAGYRPFRQLADTLSRHGIAVLRMDDRGYGESGGNGAIATSRDFADDIRAGLAWLRARPEIDASRLAIVGHSEGGLIAPMIAATDTTLRAIVLLAGPSRSGREIIGYQQRGAIERTPGLTRTQRDSLIHAAAQSLDSLGRASPWVREFLGYDPLPTARRVRHPAVLIVQGATDLQILQEQAPELEAAFRAAGNRDVTMRIFPDANHLLVQDPDGDPAKYAQLPQRAVRPDILGFVLDWLRGRLNR